MTYFPVDTGYWTSSKILDAGFPAALCHQYLIAVARENNFIDGIIPAKFWNVDLIKNWTGVCPVSTRDILIGMYRAINSGLVIATHDGPELVSVSINDYHSHIFAWIKNADAERKRLERAHGKSLARVMRSIIGGE